LTNLLNERNKKMIEITRLNELIREMKITINVYQTKITNKEILITQTIEKITTEMKKSNERKGII